MLYHSNLSRSFLVLVLLAMLGFAGGPTAAGAQSGWASGYYGPFSDGCYYYWDGYQYTQRACPTTAGTLNVYEGKNGQWVYGYDVWTSADGTLVLRLPSGEWWGHFPDGHYEFHVSTGVVAGYPDGSGYSIGNNGYYVVWDMRGNVIGSGWGNGSSDTSRAASAIPGTAPRRHTSNTAYLVDVIDRLAVDADPCYITLPRSDFDLDGRIDTWEDWDYVCGR